jgi:hypothetical protein
MGPGAQPIAMASAKRDGSARCRCASRSPRRSAGLSRMARRCRASGSRRRVTWPPCSGSMPARCSAHSARCATKARRGSAAVAPRPSRPARRYATARPGPHPVPARRRPRLPQATPATRRPQHRGPRAGHRRARTVNSGESSTAGSDRPRLSATPSCGRTTLLLTAATGGPWSNRGRTRYSFPRASWRRAVHK